MKYYSSNHFSLLYLKMLQDYLRARVSPTASRLGLVRDLGRVAFEMGTDGNRISVLRRRRFNPFLAIGEASWVLAGGNSVEPLAFHVSRMRDYSDDGVTLNGAYGYRIRKDFGIDQLERVIEILRTTPYDRRAVISLWNTRDLGAQSSDIPCNTTVYFKVRNERVDMSVCNRSNDLYLGVPYDVLTFNVLHRYVTRRLDAKLGGQCHFTDSLHVYEEHRESVREIVDANRREKLCRVLDRLPSADLDEYALDDHSLLTNKYWEEIQSESMCILIRNSYILWKSGQHRKAVEFIPRCDLGYAAIEWFKTSRFFDDSWLPSWFTGLES